MRENVIFGLICVAILAFAVLIIWGFDKGWNKNLQEKNELLGKEVVIRNDTLTVVRYSPLGDTYTLNNGTKTSSEFLSRKIVEE